MNRDTTKTAIQFVFSVIILLANLARSEELSTSDRSADPVILLGSQLRTLMGLSPEQIVGFRYESGWQQIPIQIDERKFVDFGTVYNAQKTGHGTMAYTDPNTYVGPDGNPSFDQDDELVFMLKDTGSALPGSISSPAGVFPESQVEVAIHDPLTGSLAYLYLFETDGSLVPDAGKDYVTYHFQLLQGNYIPDYRMGWGYNNPEDSEVYTNAYRTHFSDRWIRDELQIFAGAATSVDILDRHKTGTGPGDCSHSENAASNGPGAFLTNKDGCVRAIRSYMGFESGTYIQREHSFYQQQQKISSTLRVHDTQSGIRDLYDYSPEAIGMTYFNDLNLNGVRVDGIPDNVNRGPISWEMLTGSQGTLIVCHAFDTDIPHYKTVFYYGDDVTPALVQCTGDAYQYGTSGLNWDPIPFTDPVLYPSYYQSLVFYRTDYYDEPNQGPELAVLRRQQWQTPLETTIRPTNPVPPLYVDDDAIGDIGPGDPAISDPCEDGSARHPFDTIQEAMDMAEPGDTIIIQPGVYRGAGNRDLEFFGKDLIVRSVDPQNSLIVAETIIDCEGSANSLHRAFLVNQRVSSVCRIEGLTITGGKEVEGAAVYCSGESKITIRYCVFNANTAWLGGRDTNGAGGAIFCKHASPTLLHCIFRSNFAKQKGGAIYSDMAQISVDSCTLYGNTSPEGGAVWGTVQLSNCILWNNAPNPFTSDAKATYSNIQGGWDSEGNIDIDPLFADPENGDFHLQSQAGRWDPQLQTWVEDDKTSPCIDAGDPNVESSLEPIPNGNRINMGAYGGTAEASLSASISLGPTGD